FCYEPPADIGGTVTAPPKDIQQLTTQIKQAFASDRVMYGGSVNANNIITLLPLGLSGVIVATVCLNPHSFNQLLTAVDHAQI
ncbi:MAG: hypothetical protein ACD_40C00067G0002, partial [uncultured bacterium]